MRIVVWAILCLMCSSVMAQEWVPYVPPQQPVVVQNVVVQPYVMNYVPVVTYQNIVVERGLWCFHKRYENVVVPRVQYVPTPVPLYPAYVQPLWRFNY